jgi:hypothetical protein
MSKRKINLGHPDHGKGGKTGHQNVETHGGNVTRARIGDLVERRKAKAVRKQKRNIAQLMEKLNLDTVPKVNALYARLRIEMNSSKGSKRTMKVKVLAINEWYIDHIQKQMIKKRLTHTPLTIEEREQISLIEKGDHSRFLEDLLGEKITDYKVKALQEQIDKWKKRVPKMLLGQY